MHAKLGITQVTGQAMGFHISSRLNHCEDCALGKAKITNVSDKGCTMLQSMGREAFFYISSPWTPFLLVNSIGC